MIHDCANTLSNDSLLHDNNNSNNVRLPSLVTLSNTNTSIKQEVGEEENGMRIEIDVHPNKPVIKIVNERLIRTNKQSVDVKPSINPSPVIDNNNGTGGNGEDVKLEDMDIQKILSDLESETKELSKIAFTLVKTSECSHNIQRLCEVLLSHVDVWRSKVTAQALEIKTLILQQTNLFYPILYDRYTEINRLKQQNWKKNSESPFNRVEVDITTIPLSIANPTIKSVADNVLVYYPNKDRHGRASKLSTNLNNLNSLVAQDDSIDCSKSSTMEMDQSIKSENVQQLPNSPLHPTPQQQLPNTKNAIISSEYNIIITQMIQQYNFSSEFAALNVENLTKCQINMAEFMEFVDISIKEHKPYRGMIKQVVDNIECLMKYGNALIMYQQSSIKDYILNSIRFSIELHKEGQHQQGNHINMNRFTSERVIETLF